MITTKIQVIVTPIGNLVAKWTKKGLFSVQFQNAPSDPINSATHRDLTQSSYPPEKTLKKFEKSVAKYFSTGKFDWDLACLDWTNVPPFHQQVLRSCSQIDSGITVTYGELARQCGSPQAARAVGQAMARNRWPLLIPCHRVVGCSGKLTGYSGAGGLETKARLLQHERGELIGQPVATRR